MVNHEETSIIDALWSKVSSIRKIIHYFSGKVRGVLPGHFLKKQFAVIFIKLQIENNEGV